MRTQGESFWLGRTNFSTLFSWRRSSPGLAARKRVISPPRPAPAASPGASPRGPLRAAPRGGAASRGGGRGVPVQLRAACAGPTRRSAPPPAGLAAPPPRRAAGRDSPGPAQGGRGRKAERNKKKEKVGGGWREGSAPSGRILGSQVVLPLREDPPRGSREPLTCEGSTPGLEPLPPPAPASLPVPTFRPSAPDLGAFLLPLLPRPGTVSPRTPGGVPRRAKSGGSPADREPQSPA